MFNIDPDEKDVPFFSSNVEALRKLTNAALFDPDSEWKGTTLFNLSRHEDEKNTKCQVKTVYDDCAIEICLQGSLISVETGRIFNLDKPGFNEQNMAAFKLYCQVFEGWSNRKKRDPVAYASVRLSILMDVQQKIPYYLQDFNKYCFLRKSVSAFTKEFVDQMEDAMRVVKEQAAVVLAKAKATGQAPETLHMETIVIDDSWRF